jgi:hypothetical protein
LDKSWPDFSSISEARPFLQGATMNSTLKLVTALLCVIAQSSYAAPMTDDQDTSWIATSTTLLVKVIGIDSSSAINNAGDLIFGFYDLSNPATKTEILAEGLAVGDTATLTMSVGDTVGFYIANNNSADRFGAYTYYSDTLLNPSQEDAMIGENLGLGVFTLEFEDLYLPIFPGGGDLKVQISGVAPAPIPAAAWLFQWTAAL